MLRRRSLAWLIALRCSSGTVMDNINTFQALHEYKMSPASEAGD
jgi:hypothetical protein